MKKVLLLIATVSTLSVKAQTLVYHPFPEDSATWCENFCSIQLQPPNPHYWYGDATSRLDGKTLINGNWYSRMLHYARSCQASPTWCLCAQLNNEGTGIYYIRQDTAQKKVWIYLTATNSDTIFLDFNLHVGDTIDGRKAFWAQGMGNAFAIVDSIDSVLIGTQYRTRYIYLYNGFPNTMIEGIGPDHGLFNIPNQGFEYATALSVFSQNNQIFYPFYVSDTTGMGQHCYDFTTGVEEINETAFIFSFPNPTTGNFTLVFNQYLSKGSIEIYSAIGENVWKENIYNESKKEINLKNISDGIYFVKVFDGKKSYCRKLIVERDRGK